MFIELNRIDNPMDRVPKGKSAFGLYQISRIEQQNDCTLVMVPGAIFYVSDLYDDIIKAMDAHITVMREIE